MSRLSTYSVLTIGVLFLFSGCGGGGFVATHESGPRIEKLDVAYTPPANGDPQVAKMDIYSIPNGNPKRFMVFIHGGSWVTGDKSNLSTTADTLIQWFVERDFVVVAPNFRLATAPGNTQVVTYREQATDIAQALAWLSNNGSQYGVTQKEILLLGFSSGAHLVALVSTDPSYLQSAGIDLSHIRASISLDIHVYDVTHGLQLMKGSTVEANIPLIKFLFGNTAAEQLSGSPAFYAPDAPVPPSLLISAEPSLPVGSHGYITSMASKRYAQLLLDSGHQATWEHFDNKTHLSLVSRFGTAGDGPTAAVEQFLISLPPAP